MTIDRAIAEADELRANTIDRHKKAKWITDLDGQMAQRLGIKPPRHGKGEGEAELLLGEPYEEVYPLYLAMKIDYYNQEMTLYANDAAAYETALKEALAWWRREHRPKSGGNWRVM